MTTFSEFFHNWPSLKSNRQSACAHKRRREELKLFEDNKFIIRFIYHFSFNTIYHISQNRFADTFSLHYLQDNAYKQYTIYIFFFFFR